MALCRGYFSINASLADANGKFPDTYINVGKGGWGKGVAFINGFNLVGASCHSGSDFKGHCLT